MATSTEHKVSIGDHYKERIGVMYFFFKNIGYPSGEFANTIREYGNALLNTKGGFLVFGVQENGRINGLNISRQNEDLYRLSLDRELRNFTPAVSPNLYRLSVVKVGYMSNIMEVRISAGPIGEMYQNQYEQVYIVKNRKLVGPLWPQELKALIIQKYKEELQATKGILSP
ncbi:schlafen-like protein 1 [Actinia tenebrosa]|uniref:Schlafen-like protein 1 n=1 Tax=Actinia tenebrosa TaxID=6105 RepID=A0A6P8IAW2_ACTTE|nr:schlafen-like protein 1 [Actinia tenebrosa]